jgi:DNA-binding LacI/PurR family transcriptional regulator
MRRTTISDVAKAAGVTKAAVSMALRNKPGISDKLRNRVAGIASKLGYVADSARNTRGRHLNFQLALLLVFDAPPRVSGSFGGSYLGGIIEGFVGGSQGAGFNAVLSTVQRDHVNISALTFAVRGQVDAIAVRGRMPDKLLKILEKLPIPFIMLDCDRTIKDIPHVKIANVEAMDLLVDRLVRMGKRRFASITGDLDHANGSERLAGTQISLARKGLRMEEALLVCEHGFDEASGRRGCRRLLLEGRCEFDALICHNDLIAYGAIEEMKAIAPKRLRHVTVSGFDNMDFRNFVVPVIISADPIPREMGRFAAELLARHTTAGSEIGRTIYSLPCRLADDRRASSISDNGLQLTGSG